MKKIAESLLLGHRLGAREYYTLLSECDDATLGLLRQEAVRTARRQFGCGIYIRGLIELTSHCRNNCLYCGLRRDNRTLERYRLGDEEVLAACAEGYRLGFRTFVLQGGEDGALHDGRLVPLIETIHRRWPDAALTLSLGERSEASYRALHEAGATRYLLRHEAANEELYRSIHPAEMSHAVRLEALKTLQGLGYQTGMGMMVGVPGQRTEHLVEDLLLLDEMRPEMVGIGPFLPHRDTPFGGAPAGDLRLTLLLVAIVRLRLPHALIPSTTALSSLSDEGRRAGILSGANVVMPNLSPSEVRSKYAIYDGKASFGSEAAEGLLLLEEELHTIGCHIDYGRGDYNELNEKKDDTL